MGLYQVKYQVKMKVELFQLKVKVMLFQMKVKMVLEIED